MTDGPARQIAPEPGSLFAQDQTIDEIQVRFHKFDKANPRVWHLFQKFAEEARASGLERWSADAILHRIRWFVVIETKGDEDFKLNCNWSSRYARKLIHQDKSWDEFFQTRTLNSEKNERKIE